MHTDISKPKYFNFFPKSWQAYMILARMDRPIGFWLLALPCYFSLILSDSVATVGLSRTIYLIFLFTTGAFFMRSAGCVVNDIWDRNIDKLVERTKSRPIASGEISVKNAIIFSLFLLMFAVIIILQCNWLAVFLSMFALIFVILYPLAKRFFAYPQIILGITFNWGTLIAWAAVNGNISIEPFLLLLACMIWTIIYDTIYAFQDIEDDSAIGINSTAITFGEHNVYILNTLNIIMALLFILCGLLADKFWPLLISATLLSGYYFIILGKIDVKNKAQCLKIFKQTKNIGFIFMIVWLVLEEFILVIGK